MRAPLRLVLLAALIGIHALLLACGKKGAPQPPKRIVPQGVSGLKIAQRAARVIVSFQAPRATTTNDHLPILEIELWIADTDGDLAKVARKKRLRVAPGEVLNEILALPKAGTTLRVAAQAIARGNASSISPIVSLIAQDPPPATKRLVAESIAKGVRLNWEAVLLSSLPVPAATPTPSPTPSVTPGATPTASPAAPAASPSPTPEATPAIRFLVYRRAKDSRVLRVLMDTPISAATYEDPTARAGEALCYTVRTVTSTDPLIESGDSAETCIEAKDVEPPAVPGGLLVALRENALEISWSPGNDADLARYRIWRSAGGEAPIALTTVPSDTTVFRDETCPPRTPVRYRVSAIDAVGNESELSSEVIGQRP
ncbi:MAG: hypothetical protein MUF51_03080 [Vicinamibacteria bacterium]|nr:hypothetical protein [Vicinamibacteria bacterium]